MSVQLSTLTRTFQKLSLSMASRTGLSPALRERKKVLCVNVDSRSSTNFFNKLPAEDLWKGITSVSNAGRKRGRGKTVSKSKIKDLNRGQVIGIGKANMVWPGLSAPIIRGRELIERQKLPEDPEREKKLISLRDKMGTFKYQKPDPIDRGWSGSKMPGRSLGPPDPVGEDTFEGFDSKCLELRQVFHMKATFGRTRRLSTLVVTGNRAGLAGFALGGAQDARTALRKAKNRAAQKLIHVKLFEGRTVCHNFYSTFGLTKLYVWRKPEGYGLVCHRAVMAICQVLGIKDLYAKVEGSTNVNHITKAFFLGLIGQKSPEEMAEARRLHLVEFREEAGSYPKVIASPASPIRSRTEARPDEASDELSPYGFGDGRIFLKEKKRPPFYSEYYSYYLYLKKFERLRNQPAVKKHLMAEYGEVRSFLADAHPECRLRTKGPPKKTDQEDGGEEAEQDP